MARTRPRRWNLRWRTTDADTHTDRGRLRPDPQGPAASALLPEATHVPRGLR